MSNSCSSVLNICADSAYDKISQLVAKGLKVAPACRQVAEEFNKENPGAKVTAESLRKMYQRTNQKANGGPKIRCSNTTKIQKKSGIYIIIAGEKYKIGTTNNIEQRIKQLQTANPNKIKLLFYKKYEDAFSIENSLHNLLNKYKLNGEWYKLNKLMLTTITDLLLLI